MELSIASRRWLPALVLAPVVAAAGCSAPDIAGYRSRYAQPRPEGSQTSAAEGLSEVARLREKEQDILKARILALALAAENPEDAKVLYQASLCESDYALIAPNDEERDMATMSSLDYAERAVAANGGLARTVSTAFQAEQGGFPPALLGQYAWAHGNATHLMPMMSRDNHANKTAKIIQNALDADAKQPEALATNSVLQRRLADLPVMATAVGSASVPSGSLEEAIRIGRELVAVRPSVHNRMILAEALIEDDQTEEASKVLLQAINEKRKFPRDKVLLERVKNWMRELKKNAS